MSAPLNVSLRKLLGEKDIEYIQQVILPELRKLASEGKISPQQLTKIQQAVAQEGPEVLYPQLRFSDALTKNTLEEDGYIVEAELSLTEDRSIKHVIKRFSSKEEFDKTVDLESRLHQETKKVPQPRFRNRKRRIVVTPYVEGGTLKDVLDNKSEEEKETILKETIDDYSLLYKQLNDPNSKVIISQGLLPFAQAFKRYYLGEENRRLEELFSREIASELDEASKFNIHGDLHAKNILKNGGYIYLDWANAVSNGFAEIDLAKLLTKTDIPEVLEDRLAKYAAEKLYNSKKEQEASLRRYQKVQIVDNLLGAKRYLRRAKRSKDKSTKERLQNMANVWYNTALQKAEKAVNQGIISQELLEEIRISPAKTSEYSTHEVTDKELEALRKKYNPHVLMSQENQSKPLTELVQESPEDPLNKIERKLKRAKRNRSFKTSALVAVSLTGLVAAGLLVHDYMKQRDLIEALNDRGSADVEEVKQERILDQYKGIFTKAYDDLKDKFIDGKVGNGFEIDEGTVEEVALKYGVDEGLIRRMLRVSRYYSGIQTMDNSQLVRVKKLNLMDPFAAHNWGHHPTFGPDFKGKLDPVENLDYGVKRLKSLLDKHKGDVKLALLDFYSPFVSWRAGWPFNDLSDSEREAIQILNEEIAYNALKGMNGSYDAGLYPRYPRKVPNGYFKTKEPTCYLKIRKNYDSEAKMYISLDEEGDCPTSYPLEDINLACRAEELLPKELTPKYCKTINGLNPIEYDKLCSPKERIGSIGLPSICNVPEHMVKPTIGKVIIPSIGEVNLPTGIGKTRLFK
ncbi:lytic transglycosylase domain-containing protein [Candidatus Woesearchaeota archaeon]|nr:lytic transglycosylase domain-containing protein [Candidatus Woesearchaeota archaeon]